MNFPGAQFIVDSSSSSIRLFPINYLDEDIYPPPLPRPAKPYGSRVVGLGYNKYEQRKQSEFSLAA
jgi:hypothetical protein